MPEDFAGCAPGQMYFSMIHGSFNADQGPQIWYTDGQVLKRMDNTPEHTTRFDIRQLHIIKAMLELSLSNVNKMLEVEA